PRISDEAGSGSARSLAHPRPRTCLGPCCAAPPPVPGLPPWRTRREQRRRHGEGRLRQAGTHRPGRGPEQGLHHHAPHPEEQAVLPHRPQVAARQSHQGGGPRGRWLRPVRAPHDRVVAGGLRRHAEARLEGREEAPGDPQAGQEEARRDGGGAGGAAQEGRVSRGRAAGAAGRMGSSRLRCPE
ncbi:unnamed protein product, partial [Prorocentrum cordatum]